MITTGATIEAAVALLRAQGIAADIAVAATHGLLVHPATGRLDALRLRRLLVTDSVAVEPAGAWMQVASIAPMVADAVARLHDDQPLHKPRARPK